MKKLLATHLAESLLLTIAVLLIGTTIAETVIVTRNENAQAEDLTFVRTLREFSLLLQAVGPDRLAELNRRTLRVGKDAVVADTIALLATPAQEPAVATGGFIADQVALFNDHSIRQAIIESLGPANAPRTSDEGPSLFRTIVTEDADRTLSDQPNPSVLTVRSPYAERRWHDVRTRDWQRSGSMLGLAGDVGLPPDLPDRSRSQLNGRDCTIRSHNQQLLLYCQSALASDVDKFFDLGFDFDTPVTPFGLRDVFTYRRGDLWLNGAKKSFTRDSAQSGDVFDVRAVGPFVLSVSERGALAVNQWINGHRTFTTQRLGTISFFGTAGRSNSGSQNEPFVLALDAALSTDLEIEARRFMETHRALLRMSVVVIDLRTGELRAVVEPMRTKVDAPLLAFEPILVGSVVKPIVAASIIARHPDLANMTLDYSGDFVSSVAGVTLQRGFANAPNGCTGRIAFVDFIRCSINQYAAELLVRSLLADGFHRSDTIVSRELLERSSLGSGLAEVFDVDAFARRTAGRDQTLWTDSTGKIGTTPLTSNRALSPWEPRPWIVFPGTEGTPIDWLARYAFGGWENRWTLLGVAQAYARIATGRQVTATVLSQQTSTTEVMNAPAMAENVQTAFRDVRGALHRVAIDGTAKGLRTQLLSVLPEGLSVLAKTGTLNEDTDRFKALALTVGVPAGDQPSAELSCGLVTVSYFEFADNPRPQSVKTPLPSVHLEFARNGLSTVLQRNWSRLSGCGAQALAGGR